jgi:glycosyltransferase involved in cell wall biosynthesis
MEISIVIPAYNEEKVIERTIRSVLKGLKGHDFEIVAVDDNSDDTTGKILDSLAKRHRNVKAVHKISSRVGPTGMGSALIAGFSKAKGQIIIPFMGDLSDSPEDALRMANKIEEGYDVVCGSRFLEGGKLEGYPPAKLVVNRLWNVVFGFLFNMNIKDISNAFKAYRSSVIKKVKPTAKGFEITAEIALKARIAGYRITEVSVVWRGRKKSEGQSKFGSFSLKYILTKLPSIGYSYGKLAIILWFEFASKKIKQSFRL